MAGKSNKAQKSESDKAEALLKQFEQDFDRTLTDRMGHLHNRMVAFISESRLPITHVITVLQMLLAEANEQAMQKFVGE